MEDFRFFLVPIERSGSLYVNHHYDFRFDVAMCFEKRFGVEREEASREAVHDVKLAVKLSRLGLAPQRLPPVRRRRRGREMR